MTVESLKDEKKSSFITIFLAVTFFISTILSLVFFIITSIIIQSIRIENREYWQMNFEESLALYQSTPFFHLMVISLIICFLSCIMLITFLRIKVPIKKTVAEFEFNGTCMRCTTTITLVQFEKYRKLCPRCYSQYRNNKIALYIEVIWCPILFLIYFFSGLLE